MNTSGRVLLVEDDEALGHALCAVLERARYQVRWVRDGAAALGELRGGAGRDVVVLDLGLPDVDGVDLCRDIRTRWPDVVIVILTARDSEIDIIVGLEAGADDYLRKPIGASEFVARLRAHLRRGQPGPADTMRAGALTVDTVARRAWVGTRELTLRPRHFELLARLIAEPGAAVSRERLMSDVWDANWFGSTKTLDVHVAGIRRVLEHSARETGLTTPTLTTVRGFGYRLEA